MKWAIRHRTAYRYASAVRDSFNEARLRPLTSRQQRLEHFQLTVHPAARVNHYTDFYGNWVDHFDVAEPHTALELETRAVVTTFAPDTLALDARPGPLAQARLAGRSDPCFDFVQASRFTDTGPETWRLAAEATAGETDAWQAALALMRFVRERMAYEPQTTHVHTHAREALAAGCGVCQDFAHVFIGLCRSAAIPARYVSGYLASQRTSATHAWTEVFIPSAGWVGIDPTHNRLPDESYVKIATGRDYNDVSPLRGTYRGTQERTMEVEVEISAAKE
ncbi:MAG: transglutaminase family protein [Verrucomicrobiota bacterium]|jgi:transglutaminase-like putative cysteine protease